MSVVGFDFGTTNSLISYISGGRAINLLDEEGLPVPSVVCYEGAKVIVGREAKERLGEAGLGVKGNAIRSPKVLLGHESVFVDGVERSPVDIVRDVVEYVATTAQKSRGRDLDRVSSAVVTIPVDMEGYRRAALRDAFRAAGIGIVQFVHEPLAALYGFFRTHADMSAMLRKYDRKLLLVFDWGGGTLDLTLCRLVDGMLVQIANDGTDEVGGDSFDDAIRNEIVKRACKARGLDDSVEPQPDGLTRLVHRCERAKIDLSSRERVALYVPSFFRGIADESLDYPLHRNELEEIVGGLLNKGLSRIAKLLEMADVSPAQVSACLATGGMTNMPAIKAKLHEWFGPERVHVSERSGTLIAEGAAWIAHDKARLHLAKNVEIALARNSYLTLVKAGFAMPIQGEEKAFDFHLYCVDPRDGHAKFQICSPMRPGPKIMSNEPRQQLANLVVKVDSKARPFRERLELDIKLDDNLILHANARSLNFKEMDETAIHTLEFGLSFPEANQEWKGNTESDEVSKQEIKHGQGDLVMRVNIASRKDDALIPGELLYSYKPNYFDTRNKPPEYQEKEKLYYQPCLICKRPSHDPLCNCASQL